MGKVYKGELVEGSGIWNLSLAVGLASVGVGAFKGYCDSKGIIFEEGELERILKFGPTALGYCAGTIKMALYGLSKLKKTPQFPVEYPNGGDYMIGILGGGTIGAASGGIGTLIGYGLGQLAGFLTR